VSGICEIPATCDSNACGEDFQLRPNFLNLACTAVACTMADRDICCVATSEDSALLADEAASEAATNAAAALAAADAAADAAANSKAEATEYALVVEENERAFEAAPRKTVSLSVVLQEQASAGGSAISSGCPVKIYVVDAVRRAVGVATQADVRRIFTWCAANTRAERPGRRLGVEVRSVELRSVILPRINETAGDVLELVASADSSTIGTDVIAALVESGSAGNISSTANLDSATTEEVNATILIFSEIADDSFLMETEATQLDIAAQDALKAAEAQVLVAEAVLQSVACFDGASWSTTGHAPCNSCTKCATIATEECTTTTDIVCVNRTGSGDLTGNDDSDDGYLWPLIIAGIVLLLCCCLFVIFFLYTRVRNGEASQAKFQNKFSPSLAHASEHNGMSHKRGSKAIQAKFQNKFSMPTVHGPFGTAECATGAVVGSSSPVPPHGL